MGSCNSTHRGWVMVNGKGDGAKQWQRKWVLGGGLQASKYLWRTGLGDGVVKSAQVHLSDYESLTALGTSIYCSAT